jgi:hypothetical protein
MRNGAPTVFFALNRLARVPKERERSGREVRRGGGGGGGGSLEGRHGKERRRLGEGLEGWRRAAAARCRAE